MMNVPKCFYRGSGNDTGAALATVPVGKTWIITGVVIVNIDDATNLLNVMMADEYVFSNANMSSGMTITLSETPIVLEAGDVIQVWRGVGQLLSVHISGVEVTP